MSFGLSVLGDATDIEWIEDKDAVKHLTKYRNFSTMKNYPPQMSIAPRYKPCSTPCIKYIQFIASVRSDLFSGNKCLITIP